MSDMNSNINWYPGHMTGAKRKMQEDLKLVDCIIEILDARVPASSRNPDIDELGKGKGRVILLNKQHEIAIFFQNLKNNVDKGPDCINCK